MVIVASRRSSDFSALFRELQKMDIPYAPLMRFGQEALGKVGRPLFLTLSGAHLYGFPSRDSDYDLRGCHVAPLAQIVGLRAPKETIESRTVIDAIEADLVSHEIGKYLRLLVKPNGYVLEQILSPLVVLTSPEHEELKTLARGCVCKRLFAHYRGFFGNEWKHYVREPDRRIKRLLYMHRVLLTGIHLLLTGEVEANLQRLIALHPQGGSTAHQRGSPQDGGTTKQRGRSQPRIEELIKQKQAREAGVLEDDTPYMEHIMRLQDELESAYAVSPLPETPANVAAINDFLVRVRLV